MAAPAHTSARRPGGYDPPLHICAICLRPIAGQRGLGAHGPHLDACPGRAEWISASVYDRVMVLLGRRFQLYRLLVDARPDGLSHRVAHEMGVPMPLIHLESLRGEGHRIETVESTENGLPVRIMDLTEDAWSV